MDDHGLSDARPGRALDLNRPPLRLVFQLAWPVWVYQLLGLGVNFFDRLLAGRFLTENQLASQAAQTTATYLAWVLTTYTVFVSVGATALVARFCGAGDRKMTERATNQSMLLAVVMGIAGTLFGLTFLPGLLDWMEMRGEPGEYARQYM